MTRARRDPRRGTTIINPLADFRRNERCWCQSGRKYKDCHLLAGLSAPGASVPDDTVDAIFIAPHTAMARDAIKLSDEPVPITVQAPTPQAVPLSVPNLANSLARQPAAESLASHAELGTLRYALLDTHGVRTPAAVRAGDHDKTLGRLRDDLADGALNGA